jgi:hypothetical protein
LEFNRNAKRITVSHTRTFEEAPAAAAPSKERKPRTGGSGSNRMMNEVNASVERSTFGDLDVLSALKEQMDGNDAAEAKEEEKKEAKKPAKKAAAKKEDAPAEAEATAEAATDEATEEPKKPAKKAATKKPAAKKPAAKATKKEDEAAESEEGASEEK